MPHRVSYPFEGLGIKALSNRLSFILEAIDLALDQGFADSREEWIPGLSVLAAPIFVSERLAAALAVAAPSVRFDASRAETLTVRLLAAARRVGARLSGTSS